MTVEWLQPYKFIGIVKNTEPHNYRSNFTTSHNLALLRIHSILNTHLFVEHDGNNRVFLLCPPSRGKIISDVFFLLFVFKDIIAVCF